MNQGLVFALGPVFPFIPFFISWLEVDFCPNTKAQDLNTPRLKTFKTPRLKPNRHGGEGPPLRLATPFGKALVKAPDYVRRALLKQRIAPIQSDGELLLEMCYAHENNAPVGAVTFKHMMLKEELTGWTLETVTKTDHFDWLVSLALEEVTPPMEDEDTDTARDALSGSLAS